MRLSSILFVLLSYAPNLVLCEISEAQRQVVKEARQLETALFVNYSAKFRPAMFKNMKTMVQMGLYLRDLNDIDEVQHTITVHGGLHLYWNDYRLRWDTSQYKPFYLTTTPWRVWRPDWTVWNSFELSGPAVSNSLTAPYTYNHVWIYNDGTVSHYTSLTKTITCSFDYTNFPFDKQRCELLLGSWNYDYSQIDLQWMKSRSLNVNLQWLGSPTNRSRTSGWRMVDVKLKRRFYVDDNTFSWALGDEQPPPMVDPSTVWPLLVAEFTLERHRPYFALLEFTPMFLTCLLTLMCFGIDSELVATGVLFANVMAQGLISWSIVGQLPTGGTGGVPKIVHAYGLCFGLTCVVLLIHLILQMIRTLDKSSPLVLLITRIGSKPWMHSVTALKINSFGTDYQEIIELTNELESVNGINIDGKIDGAIWTVKKILFILLTLIFLIAFPITLIS